MVAELEKEIASHIQITSCKLHLMVWEGQALKVLPGWYPTGKGLDLVLCDSINPWLRRALSVQDDPALSITNAECHCRCSANFSTHVHMHACSMPDFQDCGRHSLSPKTIVCQQHERRCKLNKLFKSALPDTRADFRVDCHMPDGQAHACTLLETSRALKTLSQLQQHHQVAPAECFACFVQSRSHHSGSLRRCTGKCFKSCCWLCCRPVLAAFLRGP